MPKLRPVTTAGNIPKSPPKQKPPPIPPKPPTGYVPKAPPIPPIPPAGNVPKAPPLPQTNLLADVPNPYQNILNTLSCVQGKPKPSVDKKKETAKPTITLEEIMKCRLKKVPKDQRPTWIEDLEPTMVGNGKRGSAFRKYPFDWYTELRSKIFFWIKQVVNLSISITQFSHL